MFVWQPGLQISCWVMLVSWEGEEWLILSIQGSVIHSDVSDSLPPHGLWPASFLCPWNFARGGFLPRHGEDLREPLVRRQGSQVSMRQTEKKKVPRLDLCVGEQLLSSCVWGLMVPASESGLTGYFWASGPCVSICLQGTDCCSVNKRRFLFSPTVYEK